MRTTPVRFAAAPFACAALVVVTAASAAPAFAQSCGGCSSPGAPAGGAQRTWLEEGGFSARLGYEYEVKDRTFKGHRRVENDFSETLRTQRTTLDLRYGLDDDWTLGLDLTDPEFRYRLKPPGGKRVEITVRGPGDTLLSAGRIFDLGGAPDAEEDGDEPWRPFPGDAFAAETTQTAFRFRRLEGATLAIWGGVSLPTGDVKKPNEDVVTQDFSVSNLQTGTGTFDPVLKARADVPLGGAAAPRLFAFASAHVPFAENRHDYRTGAAYTAGAGVEIEVLRDLRARLVATFQRTETDEFRGDEVAVGGGKWLYLGTGLTWDLSERASLDAGVRWTAWRDADSKIVDSSVSIQAGLIYRF